MEPMKEKRYLFIYEKLKKKITDGTYKFGDKLPSKRVTAEDYDVSIITVEHAYEMLIEEGYIISKQRSGFYSNYGEDNFFGVSSRPDTETAEIAKIAEIADSHPNHIPIESISADLYAKTVRQVLSAMPGEVLVKSPGKGVYALREAISNYLSRSRNINVSPERIIVGSGAEYLYGMIIGLLGRDVSFAIEDPSYMQIKNVYEANGITPELLKLGQDGILSRELRNCTAGVLHVSPYRSFPSGVSASASKKREYLKFCEEKGAIIIEDDFESEFTTLRKSVDTLLSMDTNGNVIYVNTFTKTVSPAIRAAYMIIPKRLLDAFDEKLGFYACSVPTLEQYVLQRLLDNGTFERHINRVRRKLR